MDIDSPSRGAITDRFAEGFETFLIYLDVTRGFSQLTVKAYTNDLKDFLGWLPSYCTEIMPLQADENELFLELPSRFLAYLSSQKLAKTSIARRCSALKAFFKYLMKERYFDDGILPTRFHRPKLPQRLPDFLSYQEVALLLDAVAKSDRSRLKRRNLAMIHILFSSGIRVSELITLNWEHVNWDESELLIHGKGGRQRIAFVSQDGMKAIKLYAQSWHDLSVEPQGPESPLFLNKDGNRLTRQSIHRLLVKFGQLAKINKPLHPHIFRHSFATHLLNNGVDIRLVQELLGHVSIRSTQIYTHVSTERLKRAYLQAHPRAS
jgi:integrase/recombinase XerC